MGLSSAAAAGTGRAAGASGCAGAGGRQLPDVQLRSRVLKEPSLQRELWKLARKAGSAQEFGAQLEKQGLVLSAAAAADTGAKQEQYSDGDSGSLRGGSSSELAGTVQWQGRADGGSGGSADGSSNSDGEGSSTGRDNRDRGRGGGATITVPPLSRELAQAHAHDNTIIVTWANFHFSDFALNWARHLAALGISHYLVGAMDVETAEVGRWCHTVQSLNMSSELKMLRKLTRHQHELGMTIECRGEKGVLAVVRLSSSLHNVPGRGTRGCAVQVLSRQGVPVFAMFEPETQRSSGLTTGRPPPCSLFMQPARQSWGDLRCAFPPSLEESFPISLPRVRLRAWHSQHCSPRCTSLEARPSNP